MRKKMRKNRLVLAVVLVLFINMTPISALGAEAGVSVSLPSFKVTVNGQLMENTYNQYPCIVYKDITYFPMAYDYARFLGVKANWYDTMWNKVLFVGVADDPLKEFKKYPAKTANGKNYKAAVVAYDIALNNLVDFLDNGKEPYPILNFRGVTYFPLTWRFAVEEFGWEYSFDNKKGLVINSGNPFRPVIDDSKLGVTSPNRGLGYKLYHYGKDYYIGYPVSTWNENYEVIIRKRGQEQKSYSLEGQLTGGDYYFNKRMDSNGPGVPADGTSDIPPTIEGNIFSVVCIKQMSDKNQSVTLKVNLDTGKIVSEENLAPRKV